MWFRRFDTLWGCRCDHISSWRYRRRRFQRTTKFRFEEAGGERYGMEIDAGLHAHFMQKRDQECGREVAGCAKGEGTTASIPA